MYCRSRTSGSAPGVEDAQLDRNNLPEGLMTSKKREFLICSGGRRRLTPTRLTQEDVSVPLERCAQHFIVIMYVSVVSTGLKSLHLHQSGYLDPVVGGLMSRITLSVKMKRKVLCESFLVKCYFRLKHTQTEPLL